MRNRMMYIMMLIFIILIFFVALHGINIGRLEILSISQLKEKNDLLEKRIEATSELTSVDFPKNVETLDKSFEEYTIKKEKYEELTGKDIESIEKMYETKQYDISYLWRILGKYAQNRGLSLGIDVQKASGNNKTNSIYNLNFTVSGQYVNIIQFVNDLENDSDLNFRIYNFKMSGSTSVTASFTVKDINIDSNTINSADNSSESDIDSINSSKKND